MIDDSASDTLAGPGTVIAFHYDLFDADMQKIESSRHGNPVLCLHGEHGVLLALQDAFVGRAANDSFSLTVPQSMAYGRHYPERQQRISKKSIDNAQQQSFRAGQVITLRQNGRTSQATIVKVGKFTVDIDMNHPLAGMDLTFDVTIVSVRKATPEERAHGHAHGIGGHQH